MYINGQQDLSVARFDRHVANSKPNNQRNGNGGSRGAHAAITRRLCPLSDRFIRTIYSKLIRLHVHRDSLSWFCLRFVHSPRIGSQLFKRNQSSLSRPIHDQQGKMAVSPSLRPGSGSSNLSPARTARPPPLVKPLPTSMYSRRVLVGGIATGEQDEVLRQR